MRFAMKRFIGTDAATPKTLWWIVAALSLVFLLNPFLGTMAFLVFAFVSREKAVAPCVTVALTLFMWCLQSTRSFHFGEPSDWAGNYYFNFHHAGDTDAMTYLFSTGREYCWQVFNLVGYYLFSGDFLSYGNAVVAATYGFTFAAIYRFWRHTGTDVRYLVVSLCLFAFVSEVNNLSNNLLRQQFAMSMMLCVLVERCTTGRHRLWPLAVVAFLTHTMTGLFIPFLFIPLDRKASPRFYLYAFVGFGVLYVLFTNLSIFAASGFYAFQRLATASDKYVLKDVMSTSAIYPFLAVTVVLYAKAFFFDKQRSKCELYMNNLFLILICVCLLMTSMPLMQVRYFIARFFFIPLVIPYFFTAEENLNEYYLIGVPLVFAYRFFSAPSFWLAPFGDTLYRSVFDYL